MLDTYRYKVDFREVEHFAEIHEVLKRDLDFPDYYGGHLDALWDCLTDQLLSGITYIEIYNFERVMKKYSGEWQGILSVLRDTKQAFGNKYSDRFFVTLVYGDGRKEELV